MLHFLAQKTRPDVYDDAEEPCTACAGNPCTCPAVPPDAA